MAVSRNWGSCLICVSRGLLFGMYVGPPEFWKLPSACMYTWALSNVAGFKLGASELCSLGPGARDFADPLIVAMYRPPLNSPNANLYLHPPLHPFKDAPSGPFKEPK